MKIRNYLLGCSTKLSDKLKISFKAIFITTILLSTSSIAFAALAPEDIEPPTSLRGKPVPEPAVIDAFVKNKPAAIALGKALFWEARIGSDGQTACATCHFSAGADNRIKHQFGPNATSSAFHTLKPNTLVTVNDFPLTKFSDIFKNDKDQAPTKDVKDVVGSQGVFSEKLISFTPGAEREVTQLLPDSVFRVSNLNLSRVTGRNSPTNINAVFNLRNFWDGRAQTNFNGSSPWGERDPDAGFYNNFPNNANGVLQKIKVQINDASLASQAVGPLLSAVEMSATERIIPDIGKRVIPMRALANQQVSRTDSVLSSYVPLLGNGLNRTYNDLIKVAFVDTLWNSTQPITINGKQYSQSEANFSLFFGLAVQLYEATLISDQTPFDRFADGSTLAMSTEAKRGFGVFMGKGKCGACHDGALFTGAAITRKNVPGQTERIEQMLMGNNQIAVYDVGFYNIGVTRTQDDLGVGGNDPFGNPLSFSLLSKNLSNFALKEFDIPNITVLANDPVAVNGAFKTPGLRNVALTAPYMHNGGYLTLRSVVEFYNRGGNFPNNNNSDLDADIEKLNLTDQEMDDLVTFMEALTDPRVKNHAAPFDHPSLVVQDGFDGLSTSVSPNASLPGRARGTALTIPAVGRTGYLTNAVPSFIERVGGDHHRRSEPTWVTCASYGGVCRVTGTQQVRYVNSKITTAPKNVSLLTSCFPHLFGLPLVNDGGRCEVFRQ